MWGLARNLESDPARDNQHTYWEYANSDCALNFAMRVLTSTPAGLGTGDDKLEEAKTLSKRFIFIIDQDCFVDSVMVLGREFNLELDETKLGGKKYREKYTKSVRERFANETLYEFVKHRFRHDIAALYEWSKTQSIIQCNSLEVKK